MVAEINAIDRFALLASAISGRALEVAAGESGKPAWTDGRTVFIDPEATHGMQLQCVVVQAALLCAGSLEPSVLAKLARKPSATRRYLSVEGHRALTSLSGLLPTFGLPAPDPLTARRTSSAKSSLVLALGTDEIPDPPAAFGEIRPRLVAPSAEHPRQGLGPNQVPPQGKEAVLRELEDDVGEGPEVDLLSSPVGGGGSIGRLLKRLLGEARSSDTGAPGADVPTRFSRSSHRVSRMGSRVSRGIVVSDDVSLGEVQEFVYPEWDVHHRRYRPQWCTVVELDLELELEVENANDLRLPRRNTRSLRRALARLGTELEPHRRQLQGEDLDLDALVESYVEVRAGSSPDEALYIESQRSRRDLAVLVLLDISGSAGEPSGSGGTVHDHQLSAAAGLTAALHQVGDRVALYGFRSQGRSAVHVFPVKRFDDDVAALTERRLGGLTPGGFTRLGAAIRHGACKLDRHGGTGRRLLVVLSDGFAYDHGYEGAYGEADARRALSEARHRGVGCLCLSIASATDSEALRRVFGTAAHATLGTADQMAAVIAPLFRAALGTAEYQRRRSDRATRAMERLSIERNSA